MRAIDFKKSEWHQATPGFGRRLLRSAVLDLVIVAAVLIGSELLARWLMPELSARVFTHDMTGGHPKTTNSFGLRDVEFPRARPAEQRRILCVGNSTTYGSGIALESTYAKQLEQLLAREQPTFVINGGGEGTSLGKAMRFLERDGLSFGPSVVILGISPSMVAMTVRRREAATPPAEGPLPPAAPARPPAPRRFDPKRWMVAAHNELQRSYAYVLWDTQVRKRLYRLGVLRDAIDKKDGAIFAYGFDAPTVDLTQVDAGHEVLADQLVEIQRRLATHGITLVVLGMPSRFELSGDPRDNERNFPLEKIRIHPNDRMAVELAERNIPYLDLLPRLRELRAAMLAGKQPYQDLFVHGDYSHLDERGNAIAAEELYAFLRQHAPR